MAEIRKTDSVNLQEVCRTCAEFSDESILIPAFDDIQITTKINSEFQLADELLSLNVQIEKDDGLPQQMCIKCVKELTNIHTFRQICKESQTKLREILISNGPNLTSIYSITIDKAQIEENTTRFEDSIEEPASNDDYEFNDVEDGGVYKSSNEENTNLDEVDKYDENSKNKNEKARSINLELLDHTQEMLQPIRICHDCNKYVHSSRYKLDGRICWRLQMNNKIEFRMSSESEFCCFYCDEKFESRESIKGHILELHPKKKPFHCKICNEYFRTIIQLHTHIQKKHNHQQQQQQQQRKEQQNQKQQQQQEQEKEQQDQLQQEHQQQNQAEIQNNETVEHKKAGGKKIYKCDICFKEYSLIGSFLSHKKRVHTNGNFECAICFKKFTNKFKFNYHLISHDKSKQLKCKYCDKTFMQRAHRHYHEEIHTNANRPYKCEICEKDFVHRDNYKVHMTRHKGNLSHICEICGKGFSAKFLLSSHMRYHSYRFQCEYCGERFKLKLALGDHYFTHSEEIQENEERNFKSQQSKDLNAQKSQDGQNHKSKQKISYRRRNPLVEKLYTCPISVCSEKFGIPSALEKHMKVHDTNRKHKCDICHRFYITSNHLKEHINSVHLKTRYYDCSICGKRFYNLCSFNFHFKCHTDRYECSICHRNFSKKYIKNHERTHFNEIICECKICGQGFTRRQRLQNHYTTHTSEERMRIEAEILADNADSITEK